MKRVLITPRSFGQYDQTPYRKLEEAGIEVIMNPYRRIMTEEELTALIADVDGIIVGVDPLNANVLRHAKQLKAIAKYGVGTDNIDLPYAKEHGIDVSITKNANSDAVADYAFALMMAVARKILPIDKQCRQNDWKKITSIDIFKKKIGILGFGNIGKGVALRAKGFQMDVLAYDVYQDEAFAQEHGVRFTSVEEILRTCDFISVHLPLTSETRNLIGKDAFEMMKETAVLVNTARGGIINEDALYDALAANRIYGAGIDVFQQEPPARTDFYELDNLIIGSHCSASTQGAVDNMSLFAVENIIAALEGK